MKRIALITALLCLLGALYAFDFTIVRYKNGDWYNARLGVKNFLAELVKRTTIDVREIAYENSLDEEALFERSFLFINGHVPIVLNEKEKRYLRKFVLGGGFVFANDDYGMDESFRKLMREVFPDYPLTEIPFNHEVYRSFYEIEGGIPKIHEHDGGVARAYGIFIEGRLALFYAYNTDIADGWDFPEVHQNPPHKREAAFRMGVNIVIYSLSR